MKKRSIFVVGLVIIFSLMIASVAFAEEITVVTSYGGDDGNRGNYEAAVKMYEEQTGNKVNDERKNIKEYKSF